MLSRVRPFPPTEELLRALAPDTSCVWRGKPDAAAVLRSRVPNIAASLAFLVLFVAWIVVTSRVVHVALLPFPAGGNVPPREEWLASMVFTLVCGLLPAGALIRVALCHRRLARTRYVVTPKGVLIDDGSSVRFFEVTDPTQGIARSRRAAGALDLGKRVPVTLAARGLSQGKPERVALVGLGANVAAVASTFGASASSLELVRKVPLPTRTRETVPLVIAMLIALVPLGAWLAQPADVQRAIAGATRVRVRTGGTDGHDGPEDERTIADVRDPAAIACLTSWLAASEYGVSRCLCCGGPTLEFYRGERLLEALTIHHGTGFEWYGVWDRNARLSPLAQRFIANWIRTGGATRAVPPEPDETSPEGPCHGGSIVSLDFSPDGTLVASGGLDGVVKVWRTQDLLPLSHDLLRLPVRRDNPPVTTAVAPRPVRALVSPVTDTAAHAPISWFDRLLPGATTRPLLGERPGVARVRFLPDGRHLVVADVYGALVLRDLDAPERVRVFDGLEDNWVGSLAVSADGRFALTGASAAKRVPWRPDSSAVLWDLSRSPAEKRFAGVSNWASHVALCGDGGHAAAVDYRGVGVEWNAKPRALVWDTETGAVLHPLPEGDWHDVLAVPQLDLFVFARNMPDEFVAVRASTGEIAWRCPSRSWEFPSVLADGTIVSWIDSFRGSSRTLNYLDPATGEYVGIARVPHMDSFEPTAVSPDGRLLALTSARHRQVSVFPLNRRKP